MHTMLSLHTILNVVASRFRLEAQELADENLVTGEMNRGCLNLRQ